MSRDAFSAELATVLRTLMARHHVRPDDVADSLLTMVVGIFIGAELDADTLVERVRVAWAQSEAMLKEREGGS